MTKRKLAQERNWRIAQIKGAVGVLSHIGKTVGLIRSQQERLDDISADLLQLNDLYWNDQKAKL